MGDCFKFCVLPRKIELHHSHISIFLVASSWRLVYYWENSDFGVHRSNTLGSYQQEVFDWIFWFHQSPQPALLENYICITEQQRRPLYNWKKSLNLSWQGCSRGVSTDWRCGLLRSQARQSSGKNWDGRGSLYLPQQHSGPKSAKFFMKSYLLAQWLKSLFQ